MLAPRRHPLRGTDAMPCLTAPLPTAHRPTGTALSPLLSSPRALGQQPLRHASPSFPISSVPNDDSIGPSPSSRLLAPCSGPRGGGQHWSWVPQPPSHPPGVGTHPRGAGSTFPRSEQSEAGLPGSECGDEERVMGERGPGCLRHPAPSAQQDTGEVRAGREVPSAAGRGGRSKG